MCTNYTGEYVDNVTYVSNGSVIWTYTNVVYFPRAGYHNGYVR